MGVFTEGQAVFQIVVLSFGKGFNMGGVHINVNVPKGTDMKGFARTKEQIALEIRRQVERAMRDD